MSQAGTQSNRDSEVFRKMRPKRWQKICTMPFFGVKFVVRASLPRAQIGVFFLAFLLCYIDDPIAGKVYSDSTIQTPPIVAVVDHQPGLSAVDADALAGDETCLLRAEEQHHIGNVQGISHPARRLLGSIGALIDSVRPVDPAPFMGLYLCYNSEKKRHGAWNDYIRPTPYSSDTLFQLISIHGEPRRSYHSAFSIEVNS